MICNALIGSVDFLGAITYLAFGNGASSQPAAADIKLNAETYRKLLSLATRSDQTITLSCYLATTDGNGTYAEMGFFGNGAGAGADSGGLFI